MKTISVVFQYAYLVIALVMGFKAFMEFQAQGTRLWFYILFALAALGMFFFKKHFNKKM